MTLSQKAPQATAQNDAPVQLRHNAQPTMIALRQSISKVLSLFFILSAIAGCLLTNNFKKEELH